MDTAGGAAVALLSGAPRETLLGRLVAALVFGAVSVAVFGGFWRRRPPRAS